MRPILSIKGKPQARPAFKGKRMAHEKSHEKHHQSAGEAGAPSPPPHQGPVPQPTDSEVLGGVGSPTSGPSGEPLVKAPELPGQPKEGSESAAGEVGETDIKK